MKRDFEIELTRRRAADHYRKRLAIDGPHGTEVVIDGRKLLAFCTNDYLGLSNHPQVVAAFHAAADRCGVGSGAAQLISGYNTEHQRLEEELAAFTGRERVLLFSSGYLANLGVISALAGRHDIVLEDRLNHASLIDGARLSQAKLIRYRHNDAAALSQRLSQFSGKITLVATDGVFSMDGDLADLPALAAATRTGDAILMVDDAHGLGVLGAQGRGSLNHMQLTQADVPILIGTFGKALGTFGAFVAGPERIIETLIQNARTFIYTTALPPAIACATRTSLRLLQDEDWRRQKLTSLISQFRRGATELGYTLSTSLTPIQPVIVGDAARAMRLSASLREAGFYIPAIRPPTVPEGTARLRITFCANHCDTDVERLLTALDEQTP